MRKYAATLMVSLACAAAGAAAEKEAEHWGDLTPDFVQCEVGLNQSPIDIVASIEAQLPPLEIDYRTQTPIYWISRRIFPKP